MKRRETPEERIARKRAKQLAAFEESERRYQARAQEQRIEKLADHIQWLEAQEITDYECEPIDLKRLQQP